MTAWEKARHEANRLELALQTALHHKDSAEQEAMRTERERCSLLEQYTALRQTVLQGLRPYGIESLAVDGLEALLHSLSERRERWVSREKRRDLLQQKMSALELESRHLASRLLDMEKELGKQREAMRPEKLAKKGINALFHHRASLLPGLFNKICTPLVMLLPHGLVRWIMRTTKLVKLDR